MIASAMAGKLLASAGSAARVAAGVARHVVWYVAYQLDGTARTDEAARKLNGRAT